MFTPANFGVLFLGLALVNDVLAGSMLAQKKENKLALGRSTPFDFEAHNADLERIRRKYGFGGSENILKQGKTAAGTGKIGTVPQIQIPALGSWLGEVYVGTPGQKFYVVIDTGSSDFWIDGVPKGISSTGYTPKASTSAHDTGRKFSDWYGDGSQGISGDLYTDVVSLGGLNATDQVFGRGTTVVGSVSDGIDGIMGLAFQPMSSFNSPNPFQTIVNQGKAKNIFAASMGNNGSAEFTFGFTNPEKYTGDITYHKLAAANYWNVEMAMGFNGNVATGNFRGAIDTGTTVVYLQHDIAKALYDSIGGQEVPWWETGGYRGYFSVPCDLTGEVSFQIDQTIYAMPIDHNFFGGTVGSRCIGNIVGESIGDASKIDGVIGDLFLTHFYSVYDGEGMQMGFAAGAPGTSVTTLIS